MKKILVLGAGMISRPLVRYFLDMNDCHVTVASLEDAEKVINGHERGTAMPFDIQDRRTLDKLVGEHDLSISLLPYQFHVDVAKLCLKHKKHLVTASYVSEEMKALDKEAKAAGLTFLNEMGLDPGLDHMSAMKVINDIKKRGGTVTGFYSYCGGLPAPEADTNPWGYKFSWSPRGVIMAGRNNARFLRNGEEIEILGPDLFSHHWQVSIQGYGELEAYPNRDSIPYIKMYHLEGIKDMFRGTLRNLGWCFTMKKLADLNYFDLEPLDLQGKSYADLMRQLTGISNDVNLKDHLARHLDIHELSDTMQRIEWLGLLSEEPIRRNGETGLSPLDALTNKMLKMMSLHDNERDFCVMQHEIAAEYGGGRKEKTYSTLLQFGIPNGDSAMARTVSLPAAIGGRMLLDEEIAERGVLIPVLPCLYEPILRELEQGAKIEFIERTVSLNQDRILDPFSMRFGGAGGDRRLP